MGTQTPPHVLVVERFGVRLKIGRPWTPQSVHDFVQASFFPIGIPNLQNSAKTSTKAIIYIASDHLEPQVPSQKEMLLVLGTRCFQRLFRMQHVLPVGNTIW